MQKSSKKRSILLVATSLSLVALLGIFLDVIPLAMIGFVGASP